jgi:5'/3'-nucleotidase
MGVTMLKHALLAACCLAVVTVPASAQTIRVLVTNDDGIGAPGIAALADELAQNPNLIIDIVAPATNQSGTSDTFSTMPFGVAAGTTASGTPGTAVSGTPADSVLWALFSGQVQAPDIVVSGINFGQNIARFVAEDTSGTVGAALTAGRNGIPAVAVSAGIGPIDYGPAARYVANVVEDFRSRKRLGKKMISKDGLDTRIVLNVNFPTCATGAVRGVVVVPLANSQNLLGQVVNGYTMTGPSQYQATLSADNAFTTDCTSTLEDPTTDVAAMNNGFASVTPLNPTLTVDSKIKKFKFLAKFKFN